MSLYYTGPILLNIYTHYLAGERWACLISQSSCFLKDFLWSFNFFFSFLLKFCCSGEVSAFLLSVNISIFSLIPGLTRSLYFNISASVKGSTPVDSGGRSNRLDRLLEHWAESGLGETRPELAAVRPVPGTSVKRARPIADLEKIFSLLGAWDHVPKSLCENAGFCF